MGNNPTKLEVCVEETLEAIRGRYLPINAHAESYTWKRLGKVLDMKKTLEQNGVKPEPQHEHRYIPAIHEHFNADLTEG